MHVFPDMFTMEITDILDGTDLIDTVFELTDTLPVFFISPSFKAIKVYENEVVSFLLTHSGDPSQYSENQDSMV